MSGTRNEEPKPGTILDNRYRLDAMLGAGGMGTVYSGRHLLLDRPVAIKLLHPHVAATPGATERFHREAQILAKLKHPGAVEVYDFGQDGDNLYIAMELLSGMPMDTLAVSPPGAIDLARGIRLCAQALDVLSDAHALGIVHRDLKPGNLFVESPGAENERIKVVDFGLAYLTEEPGGNRLTEAGMVHGTPEYMAPEQCLGQVVDGRADLYAIGCVLWEIVTGMPPFGVGQAMQIMTAHVYKPLPALAEAAPGVPVPKAVEATILRALAKRPEDRFPDAAAMRDDIVAALSAPDEQRGVGKKQKREARAALPDDGAPGGCTVGLWQRGRDATDGPGIAEALGAAGFMIARVDETTAPGDIDLLVVSPLPGTEGLEIASQWARQPNAPPVILCGTDDLMLMTRAIERGVDDYVVMPLDPPDLVRKASRALRKADRRRTLSMPVPAIAPAA